MESASGTPFLAQDLPSSSCMVEWEIPIIGDSRFRRSPGTTKSSCSIVGATAAARATAKRLMATDVLSLMDALHVTKAALVGWSDGAIIGLDIAIHHPDRLTRLFAFAANSDTSGVKDVDKDPVFNAYFSRTKEEYKKLSPTPTELKVFSEQLDKMWDSEPHFSDDQLRSIKVPTWIVDGDRDEVIKRENTDHMAALIPAAGELILPEVI